MLAVAVFLVLFARDAWHWQRALRDGDARAAAGPRVPDGWSAEALFPGGLARRTLGISDDLAFRHLAARALASLHRLPNAKERAVLEAQVQRLVQRDGDRSRASLAATYLALLYFTDPAETSPGARSPDDKAIAELQTAVRLDPRNDVALRDLELLIEQQQAQQNQRGSDKPGSGQRAGTHGAGLGPPGGGY
jgi:hypothetical protein